MDEKELREICHQQKTTIFMADGKRVSPSLSGKRAICHLHIMLANMIYKLISDENKRSKVLAVLDEAYDCGKRMDRALDDYRRRLGIGKGEGHKQEKEFMNSIDFNKEEDVIPQDISDIR